MRSALIVVFVILLRAGVWLGTGLGIEIWRTRLAGRAYLEALEDDGVLTVTTSVGKGVVTFAPDRFEAWNAAPHAVWVLQRGTDDDGVACLRLVRLTATSDGIDVALGGWLEASRFDIDADR